VNRQVRERVVATARAVAEERGLENAFAVAEEHVDAVYARLWAWDKLAVEMQACYADVRHALEIAVADLARAVSLPRSPCDQGACVAF